MTGSDSFFEGSLHYSDSNGSDSTCCHTSILFMVSRGLYPLKLSKSESLASILRSTSVLPKGDYHALS